MSVRSSVREDVAEWLAAHWDPDLSLLQWRSLLVDSGWGCPTWPLEWYGRGLPPAQASVVAEEFDRVGAVGTPAGVSMSLAAPTLLEHASDDLKRLLLRRIVTGEDRWCQLFSEPGSGSDLAGATTRAEREGDGWVVNGGKVWTTSAQDADFGLLVARTDWDAPKHRGLTYFVLPMRQPGIEVHPLRQMNGHASFNQIFIADARIPADHVVGEVGGGWTVALTTLAHERRLNTGRPGAALSTSAGRAVLEAAHEAEVHFAPYHWYPQRAGRPDLLVQRARETGRADDPAVRQAIARVTCLLRTAEWTAERARLARAAGRPPGAEGSIGKLMSSVIARASRDAHSLISGADGLLAGPDAPYDGLLAEIQLSVPAVSIAGGTDEIQHNIVAERVLGLPREPAVDRDKPFREVRHG